MSCLRTGNILNRNTLAIKHYLHVHTHTNTYNAEMLFAGVAEAPKWTHNYVHTVDGVCSKHLQIQLVITRRQSCWKYRLDNLY